MGRLHVLLIRLVLGLLWASVVCCGAALAQEETAKSVNAHFEGEVIPLNTNATTVAGFLSELSIELPASAAIQPPQDSALMDGMSVFLKGLTVTRMTTEELIPVEMLLMESSHYGPEKMMITNPGRAGRAEVSYTVFYYDGHEVGRRRRAEVIEPMVPTQAVFFHQLYEGDGPTVEQILEMRLQPGDYHVPPTRYKKLMRMEATAYEPGPRSCGRFASGWTSAGYEAGYGVVAVDPNVIPLHTRLFIEGYGYAVAGDRGSAIKGNRIDLGFLTVDECIKFGRRDVDVYVLY